MELTPTMVILAQSPTAARMMERAAIVIPETMMAMSPPRLGQARTAHTARSPVFQPAVKEVRDASGLAALHM